MSENLIFALVVGFTVYLFVRRLRLLRARRRPRQDVAAEAPATMPRLGEPGTITREQIRELRANDFEPSRIWSREEAQLVLDAVAYLRAVVRETTGEADPPLEVQNHLLKLILTEEDLRDHVREWGLNRTRDDELAPHPELDRDDAFARVEAAVRELWED